jgi:hypothetical protein
MNSILDEVEKPFFPKKIYSRLAFAISIISVILILSFFSFKPATIKAKDGFPVVPKLLISAIYLSCISGAIVTRMSLVQKDPSSILKWVGGILNTLIFLILLGSIIFANIF